MHAIRRRLYAGTFSFLPVLQPGLDVVFRLETWDLQNLCSRDRF
jgi:hypothetical protein